MPQITAKTLVTRLRRAGALTDPQIEAALLAVPRQFFLPGVPPSQVYRDASLPLKHDAQGNVTIASTQPSLTARMLAQLRLQPGHNVLQIGAGSGYTAALIRRKGVAVEIDRITAEQARDNLQRALMGAVTVVEGDGAAGYPLRASYDRIIANATIWDVPQTWVRQLKPNGVLVAPLWVDALQYSAAFGVVADGALVARDLVPCSFVPLRGQAEGPIMTLRVGGSALRLPGRLARVDSAVLHTLLSETAEIDYLRVPSGARESADWPSCLPYLMLNLPTEYVFCLYSGEGAQLPYGMDRRGFAVIQRNSAAFISLEGDLKAWIFGGVDAFMAAQDTFNAWHAAGRPGDEHVHLRLVARAEQPTDERPGLRIYTRVDHDLHVWQA